MAVYGVDVCSFANVFSLPRRGAPCLPDSLSVARGSGDNLETRLFSWLDSAVASELAGTPPNRA